ncbi:MAG: DedA family protein [Gammaproteobacteria bacterium]|nr:DedA family protein [Gammaproteobacteria bacterium]NND39622.1 DedA family protein [Pseudomonadales bacterium]RZV51509.1 MAG: DedA family protein [Pseudomonadales bacterium]
MYIVPAVAFLEASVGVGLFTSGAILLTICTALYAQNIATLQQMLPLAFLGATTADHMGYFLGRWIGPGFHHTRFAEKYAANISKTEKLLLKHGELSIVLGRLIPAVRSVVPLLTGISGLPVNRYMRYDMLACVIWAAGLGLLVAGLGGLFT